MRRSSLITGLLLIACMVPVSGCDLILQLLGGSPPAGLPTIPPGSILVLVDNQSGFGVLVSATFVSSGLEVRETNLRLDPEGPQSSAALVRTTAQTISVSAVIAGVPGLAPGEVQGGFVLAEALYTLGVDFQPGDTITFTVPPPPFDCNGNGEADENDVISGFSEDCNGNAFPDECELDNNDCNDDGVPDDCQPDCNANGQPDDCDLDGGASEDCNSDGVPDECQLAGNDCDGNIVPDDCQPDCDGDGVPDECESDCDDDGVPDACVIQDCQGSPSCQDCNGNGIPDACDIGDQTSTDCDANGVPDECQPDCDDDGVPDACVFLFCDEEPSCDDCNENGLPDGCDIQSGFSADCNENAIPDECDIADCYEDPDCQDCNENGEIDICETGPRVFWSVSDWEPGKGSIQSALADGFCDYRIPVDRLDNPLEVDLDPSGGQMYWGEFVRSGELLRADFDGGALESLGYPFGAPPGGLAFARGISGYRFVYWTEAPFSLGANYDIAVYGVSVEAADEKPFLVASVPGSMAGGVVVHEATIYWAQTVVEPDVAEGDIGQLEDGRILQADLDDPSPETLYRTFDFDRIVLGVAVAPEDGFLEAAYTPGSGEIYWVEQYLEGGGKGGFYSEIRRGDLSEPAPITGETIVYLDSLLAEHIALDVGSGKVYWTLPYEGQIMRANLDGSDLEVFTMSYGLIQGIAVLHGND